MLGRFNTTKQYQHSLYISDEEEQRIHSMQSGLISPSTSTPNSDNKQSWMNSRNLNHHHSIHEMLKQWAKHHPLYQILVLIEPENFARIANIQWHPSQHITKRRDGSIILQIQSTQLTAVESMAQTKCLPYPNHSHH